VESQNVAILHHMRRGWIDPMQALKLYGCFRLSARAYDIKSMLKPGETLQRETVVDKRSGKRWAAYRVVKK
jgi:hypothetical protein